MSNNISSLHEMTSDEFMKLLPEDLRDFHDQKDFFKTLHDYYRDNKPHAIPGNPVDNHIFTIDFLLWFLAKHGYRLQRFKSRHFQQYDLNETIQQYTEIRRNKEASVLMSALHSKDTH